MCWLNSLFQEYRMQIRSSMLYRFSLIVCHHRHRRHFNLAWFEYCLYTLKPINYIFKLRWCFASSSANLSRRWKKKILSVRESENAIHSFIRYQPMSYACVSYGCEKNIYYQIKSNQVSTHRKQTIEFLLSITSSAATARTFADFSVLALFCSSSSMCTYFVWGSVFSLFNHRVNGEDKKKNITVPLPR